MNVLRRAPLPRAEIDGLLGRYRAAADEYGPNSKSALKVRNELIEVNLRLAAKIASHCSLPTGWERDDLIAAAVPGLIIAIERFDLPRGLAFSTYASWWIRHAIQREMADNGRTVRVPVHAADAVRREERGDAGNASKTAKDARAATRAAWSLDAPMSVSDGATTFGDMLADPEPSDPIETLDRERLESRVRAEIAQLPANFRSVIEQRLEEKTLLEIGKGFDRSRERVRQLQEQALGVMRPRLRDVSDLAG